MANTRSVLLTSSANQYLFHAANAAYDISGDLTFEVWVKFITLPINGNQMAFISKWFSSGNARRAYLFQIPKDAILGYLLSLAFRDNATNNIQSNSFPISPIINKWYYYAISFKSSTKLYSFYQGDQNTLPALLGTTTGTVDNDVSSSNFAIGGQDDGGGSFLDALIDEVRGWSAIRSLSDLQTNYKRELAGNESNLAFYNKFNNNYIDTVNGLTLTPQGTTSFSTDVPFDDTTTTSTSSSTTTTSTSTTSTSTSTTSTSSSTSITTSSSTSTSSTISTTSTSTTTTSTSTTSTSTSTTTTSTSTTTTSTSITTSTSTSTSTTIDLTLTIENTE